MGMGWIEKSGLPASVREKLRRSVHERDLDDWKFRKATLTLSSELHSGDGH
jgi:hypothetical protein